MFDRITNTSLDIFTDQDKTYLGRARFVLTSEAESKLLNLLNYSKVPDSLVIMNASLYEPPKNYTPPEPSKKYRRDAIFNAVVRDSASGMHAPLEIRLRYDVRARGNPVGNLYRYDSLELSNIEVVDIKQKQF